ncbi:hypothetical protein GCM10011415_06260 [Salipiger pallidus]|uniref:Ribosomal protein L11 methyltransferase (PrmA) n=1 Tax=Salipiger pallidus TaxID=1775170 RepID=A0A8J2ZGW3_9RHOB|nr:50S ribosomal protein L11 methyltransferase [Salipiger pallidus]GGG62663.1 hypothetical protein GCM10011415_06260 [Salipiger pallidus]
MAELHAQAEAAPVTITQADRLVEKAIAQPLTDGGLRTAELLTEALDLDPQHHRARILLERLHQMFVPRWHFPMMADTDRNRAYAEAIAAKVKPGDVVLDIGCGAGLTAMLSARAGAKHVYTCEQQPLIAETAKRVIAANGLSDRITVISKPSHQLEVGVDLPEPADVVVSEIVDTMMLGEGALATLLHAMVKLAKPEARAIPESGRLMAQAVESDRILELWRPREAEGFDLGAFHHFAKVAQLTPNDIEACGLSPVGEATELFSFDFVRPKLGAASTMLDLPCSAHGMIHAVLVFFEMQLAPGIIVSNGAGNGGHWGRTAFLLDRPVPSEPGSSLRLSARHDGAELSLSVDGSDTPAPRWRRENRPTDNSVRVA